VQIGGSVPPQLCGRSIWGGDLNVPAATRRLKRKSDVDHAKYPNGHAQPLRRFAEKAAPVARAQAHAECSALPLPCTLKLAIQRLQRSPLRCKLAPNPLGRSQLERFASARLHARRVGTQVVRTPSAAAAGDATGATFGRARRT
jgi:hypothetical protein